MVGIIIALMISILLPLCGLIYSLSTKRGLPFVLGILAFVLSQMVLRIPLINYVSDHSIQYHMFRVTHPVVFALFIGFSAGVFEEFTRFFAMRFFMKLRDWKSGILFGFGHGSIEAVLFLGVPVVSFLFTTSIVTPGEMYALGGLERFFAMLLHIGLSILVLQTVVTKRIHYLLIAIVLHGVIDSFVGLASLMFSYEMALWAIEGVLIVMSIAVMMYSIRLKRKGVL